MNDLNELHEMLCDDVDFLGNLTTIYLLIAIPKKKESVSKPILNCYAL